MRAGSFYLTDALFACSALHCLSLSPFRKVAEGVKTAQVVIALAKKYNLILPVLTAVAQVVDGQLSAKEAVDTVMTFPQIDDVEEGFDFYKQESENGGASAGAASSPPPSSAPLEQKNELTGV